MTTNSFSFLFSDSFAKGNLLSMYNYLYYPFKLNHLNPILFRKNPSMPPKVSLSKFISPFNMRTIETSNKIRPGDKRIKTPFNPTIGPHGPASHINQMLLNQNLNDNFNDHKQKNSLNVSSISINY